MDNKIEIIRELINRRKNKIQAFLITSAEMRRWFANVGTSVGYILITKQKSYLLIDNRYYQAMIKNKSLINIDEILQITDSYIEKLVELLNQEKNIKSIGVEAEYVNVAFFQKLTESLAVNVSAVSVSKCRIKKTEAEIASLKLAADINDGVYTYLKKKMKSGMTEKEVANIIKVKMFEYGADEIGFPPIVGSGPNSAIPHHRPTFRKIKAGDLVVVDIGCIVDGYNSDSTRTFGIEKLSTELKNVYKVVYLAQKAGCESVKIGKSLGNIDSVCRKKISKLGYGKYFTHGTGHGIGVEVHEEPYVVPANKSDIVQNNMIFTIEPGIYLPNVGGVRIEDEVLIVDGKVILLNKTPKELLILNN